MLNVKEISKVIKEYLTYDEHYCRISFDKIENRDFCAYTSEELNDIFLNGFGGNYESSITFRFSNGVGLEAEVYLSNNKAKRIGLTLDAIIRKSIDDIPFKYRTTRFIPNESSMTFTLSYDYAHQSNTLEALKLLGNAIKLIALELAEY